MDTAIMDLVDVDLDEEFAQLVEFGAADSEPIIESGLNVRNCNDSML